MHSPIDPAAVTISRRDRILFRGAVDLPVEWRDTTASCIACGQEFQVTAAEQRFWYETLRIPEIVEINRCPACRLLRRRHRHIMARLSVLAPQIDAGSANERDLREAVILVAEGMVCIQRHRTGSHMILNGTGIARRAIRWIGQLRRLPGRHEDLLPILALCHERIGDRIRASRVRAEDAAGLARWRSRRPAHAIITKLLAAPSARLVARALG
ncbi:MAG: putative zinc-ribbon domain [Planctomycetota bacterium]|jgi:hypothetical protein